MGSGAVKGVGGDEEIADAEGGGGFLKEDHAEIVGFRREPWAFGNADGLV